MRRAIEFIKRKTWIETLLDKNIATKATSFKRG